MTQRTQPGPEGAPSPADINPTAPFATQGDLWSQQPDQQMPEWYTTGNVFAKAVALEINNPARVDELLRTIPADQRADAWKDAQFESARLHGGRTKVIDVEEPYRPLFGMDDDGYSVLHERFGATYDGVRSPDREVRARAEKAIPPVEPRSVYEYVNPHHVGFKEYEKERRIRDGLTPVEKAVRERQEDAELERVYEAWHSDDPDSRQEARDIRDQFHRHDNRLMIKFADLALRNDDEMAPVIQAHEAIKQQARQARIATALKELVEATHKEGASGDDVALARGSIETILQSLGDNERPYFTQFVNYWNNDLNFKAHSRQALREHGHHLYKLHNYGSKKEKKEAAKVVSEWHKDVSDEFSSENIQKMLWKREADKHLDLYRRKSMGDPSAREALKHMKRREKRQYYNTVGAYKTGALKTAFVNGVEQIVD